MSGQELPLVTSQYYRDLVHCVNTRQQLPPESAYLPPVAATELQLRDPNISFCRNTDRGKLFRGLTFVFFRSGRVQFSSSREISHNVTL